MQDPDPDLRLEAQFPAIPWRQPIVITVPGLGTALVCRLCIARFGFQGREVSFWPNTQQEFLEHMTIHHPTYRAGEVGSGGSS